MSQLRNQPMPRLPDPKSAPDLFEDILQRRVIAFLIDAILIFVLWLIMFFMTIVAGFFTFGLAWLSVAVLGFAAPLLYYVLTLSGEKRATLGMRRMDIVLTSTREEPLDSWRIIAHVVLFWLSSTLTPFIYCVGLFTQRRQLVHDLLVGTLMLRRSPMDRHWKSVGAY